MPDEKKSEEDLDRELIELLNELRVALPGVQVLFAFLLAVPFANGWRNVDGAEKAAFFVSFLATTVSSALLIAPSAFHRIQWREQDKEYLLSISNRLAIAGLGFLGIAICAAVFLIADFVYNPSAAIALTVLTLVLYGGLWYVVPLLRRARTR
ncbi:MAG: DUF6328 family protein [Actinomycetota bacterium]|nr:DUF6328 family protein [Actinomycetota bacterium]